MKLHHLSTENLLGKGRASPDEPHKVSVRRARKLTLENLVRHCQASDKDIRALDKIINGGQLARNAQSRIRALELKWSYGYGRPKQVLEHQGKLTLEQLILDSEK